MSNPDSDLSKVLELDIEACFAFCSVHASERPSILEHAKMSRGQIIIFSRGEVRHGTFSKAQLRKASLARVQIEAPGASERGRS